MSIFESIELLPADPILGTTALFNADEHAQKVNLSIGVYKDAEGKPALLSSVQKAEEILVAQKLNKEYPPIEGLSQFTTLLTTLVLGEKLATSSQLFSLQIAGGTGALRIGADFFVRHGFRTCYLPDPTWANHHLLFTQAGMNLFTYPYYDSQHHAIDFDRLYESVKQMPPHSIILLHACCHNPSGIDPSPEHWRALSVLIKKQQLIPFFDLAYLGFGQDLDRDAYAVRHFVEQGHELFIATSCSKNFGLYGERVGMLTLVTQQQRYTSNIVSHLRQLIRSNYSVPPLHGARIVSTILHSSQLKAEWIQELEGMRSRIQTMRERLRIGLIERGVKKDLNFLSQQKGLFSFTGLTSDQVDALRQRYGVYLIGNGRINIAGLNENNIEYATQAIAAVMK